MQNTNRTAFNYWKVAAFLFIATIIQFVTCNKSYGQTNGNAKQDSAAIIQQQANKFIDSITTHTSIKEFQSFLYESVSGKTYAEGKFNDLYNYFVQTKYNLWIQEKEKLKEKPKK